MGHLMRCIAIAEAAVQHGWLVRWGGDLSPDALRLLARFFPETDVESMPPRQLAGWLRSVAADGPAVLHVDSYLPQSDVPPGSPLLSNMQDGSFGARRADLCVDGNLGAESRPVPLPAACTLLGIRYMPIRRQVLRQRDVEAPRSAVPRVLIVIGGTDPFGVTEKVVSALQVVPGALDVTVVAPASGHAAAAAADQSHRITVVPFLDDLPAAARSHDLVISAAGTSIWDFACMGVPTALLCVVDNQRDGYEAAVRLGLGIGLGTPPYDALDQRLVGLRGLLDDADRLEAIATHGRRTVDGRGASRIVAAWEAMLDDRS